MPIPLADPPPYRDEVIGALQAGSSRADVLFTLGAPNYVHRNDRIFVYAGDENKMAYIVAFGAGYSGAVGGGVIAKRHLLVIEFDDDGRLLHREVLGLGLGTGSPDKGGLGYEETICTAWGVCLRKSGASLQSWGARYPALRDELLAREKKDQDARWAAIEWDRRHGARGVSDAASVSAEAGVERDELTAKIAAIDADNAAWLKGIVDERGWPTYSDVGVDGGDAAWLMVQHADADPAFQRRCLDLMKVLPEGEMSQRNVAYLTDRVRIAEGRMQLYGTQFVRRNGAWVPLDIEDEASVDKRRLDVGLPTLDEYATFLEETYRGDE